MFLSNFFSSINADLTNSYLCDENAESKPRYLSKDRITLDEEKVLKCYQVLRSWENPFKHISDLCHLSPGVKRPQAKAKDLTGA